MSLINPYVFAAGGGGGPATTDYDDVILADSPVGYWPLRESSGTVAEDYSGNELDGAYVGSPDLRRFAPAALEAGVSANEGAATGQYVDLGDLSGLGVKGIELWLAPDALVGVADSEHLVRLSATDGDKIGLGAQSSFLTNEIITVIRDNGSGGNYYWAYTTGPDFEAQAWHHLVVQWNGTGYDIYLDGVQVRNATNSSPGGSAAQVDWTEVFVGANPGVGDYEGKVAAVAVYDVALSQAQIDAHYLAGLAPDLVAVEPFVDETGLEAISGVTQSVNDPTKDGSNPLLPSGTNSDTWDADKGYCTVIKDGSVWRLWYFCRDGSGFRGGCYATSTDGVNWTKPNVGQVTYGGNTNNNIVLDSRVFNQIVYDPVSGRWLMVSETDTGGNTFTILAATDPAGPFTTIKTFNATESYAECKALLRRPSDGRWLLYSVSGHASQSRSIYAYLSDTDDIEGTWSRVGVLLSSPGQDEQFYGIGPWSDGDQVYANVIRYNKTTEQLWLDLYELDATGTSALQLAADWVLPGTAGAWDDEMIAVGTTMTVDGDTWRLYYPGYPEDHAFSGLRDSRIGRAAIGRRRIGQVSGTGEITTLLFDVRDGATLAVTADATGGTLDLELLDAAGSPLTGFALADFDTISSDVTDAEPTWGGLPMPDTQDVKVRAVLSSATLHCLTMAPARRGTPAGFDPISLVSWHAAFWAEGPNFEALGLSNGSPVATWPDESGNGRDATQATSSARPVFAVAGINGKPAVDPDGGDWLQTAGWTAISQPFTVVAIGAMHGDVIVLTDGNGASNRHQVYTVNNLWTMFSGTKHQGATGRDTATHLFIATFNSPSGSTLEVDGSTVVSAGDSGSHQSTGMTLFSSHTGGSPTNLPAAFFGLYAGTLTAQEKADLLAWAQSHYGTP